VPSTSNVSWIGGVPLFGEPGLLTYTAERLLAHRCANDHDVDHDDHDDEDYGLVPTGSKPRG
jgi:hypothetical protein